MKVCRTCTTHELRRRLLLGYTAHLGTTFGNTELAHFATWWYDPNSNTLNITAIHYWHVSLPNFSIFDIVWCHRWHHRGPSGSSAFFVNNFRSTWYRESIKAPLWWHWVPETTGMQLDPPISIHDLRGCDLILTLWSTLTLIFTKLKVHFFAF